METARGAQRAGFVEEAWAALAASDLGHVFDVATLAALPPPAQRLLGRALPDGVELSSCVELAMSGEIKLAGRWLPFTAEQILRAGTGFVWASVVGGRLARFVGADVLAPDVARMEFRLHGRIPLVRAAGPDLRRSARGRLAAETVAWIPQALAPQSGARWRAIDDRFAVVTIDAAGTDIDVEVGVDGSGQIASLGLQRWKDSAKPPTHAPFGGSVGSTYALPNGVCIAGSGTVGWDWKTSRQHDGEFFRYRITAASLAPSAPARTQ